MAEGVVLDSAAHLVDVVVGEADDVERVGDLAGVGQRHVEGAPVRPGEPQHTPVDTLAPRLGVIQQPPGGTVGVATRDNAEQLALGYVYDQRALSVAAPAAVAPDQGLIET